MSAGNGNANEGRRESALTSTPTSTHASTITSRNGCQTVRIGSRKSKLALIQTNIVVNMLSSLYGSDRYEFEIDAMNTVGDTIIDLPLAKIGQKSLFTGDLEDKLLDSRIDLIVHSLKDLPTRLPDGCCIAAIIERDDPRDALVLKACATTAVGDAGNAGTNEANDGNGLADGMTIGTSSLRRIAQVKHRNRNASVANIRGNINTRLAKLDAPDSQYSALILASAGLKRADYGQRISKVLDDDWYYAVGQGAIAVECRADDQRVIELLRPLVHFRTTAECLAERALMKQLEGGCSVPIGVKCSWSADQQQSLLTLSAAVFSLDGSLKVENQITSDLNEIVNESVFRDYKLLPENYTGILFTGSDRVLANRYLNSHKTGCKLANILLNSGAKQVLDTFKLKI